MIGPRLLVAAALVATLTAPFPAPAQAADRSGVSMEVLVDGRPMTEHRSGSRSYVEAKKGRNYTIVLRNDTSGRVAVALAVDGLNTIDAKHTAAIDGRKWVLGPHETAEIKGWQVDGDNARKFVFTSEAKSYGAWVGETSNLGIISAVFYGENPGPICCAPTPRDPYGRYELDGEDAGSSAGSSARSPARGEGPTSEARRAPPASKPGKPAEPMADSGGEASGGRLSTEAKTSKRGKVADGTVAADEDERAATGMGARTRHTVEWVAFDLDPDPITSFDVRYAYRDELLALGIDPDWTGLTPTIERRERAEGFAPDPGRACCR